MQVKSRLHDVGHGGDGFAVQLHRDLHLAVVVRVPLVPVQQSFVPHTHLPQQDGDSAPLGFPRWWRGRCPACPGTAGGSLAVLPCRPPGSPGTGGPSGPGSGCCRRLSRVLFSNSFLRFVLHLHGKTLALRPGPHRVPPGDHRECLEDIPPAEAAVPGRLGASSPFGALPGRGHARPDCPPGFPGGASGQWRTHPQSYPSAAARCGRCKPGLWSGSWCGWRPAEFSAWAQMARHSWMSALIFPACSTVELNSRNSTVP